jgi:hypothetical protein
MNRIRKYKNKIQVLITPHHRFDPGFELMLGAWTDDHLRNYHIMEFIDMDDALGEAFNYPDIDWEKMVLFHKDIYVKLYKIIKSELQDNDFITEFEPQIMTANQIKETMFDRVMKLGKRFKLNYNLNDIIGYHIINPWGKNLREIYKILKNNRNLRIVRHEFDHGVIRAIGETDIGTNYEIVLWPTLIAHWAKWSLKHPELSMETKESSLKDVSTTQTQIEKIVSIR